MIYQCLHCDHSFIRLLPVSICFCKSPIVVLLRLFFVSSECVVPPVPSATGYPITIYTSNWTVRDYFVYSFIYIIIIYYLLFIIILLYFIIILYFIYLYIHRSNRLLTSNFQHSATPVQRLGVQLVACTSGILPWKNNAVPYMLDGGFRDPYAVTLWA